MNNKDNENNGNGLAFGIGMFVFIIGFTLIWKAFFPDLRISKVLFVIMVVASGIVGVVVKDWIMTPSPRRKSGTQNKVQQLDEAMLRKNKNNIIADLQSENPDIRAEAMTNLAILKDLDSVDLLIQGLRDKDRMVRLRATESLSWITGQDFGEDEEKWNEWWARNNLNQQSGVSDEKKHHLD